MLNDKLDLIVTGARCATLSAMAWHRYKLTDTDTGLERVRRAGAEQSARMAIARHSSDESLTDCATKLINVLQ